MDAKQRQLLKQRLVEWELNRRNLLKVAAGTAGAAALTRLGSGQANASAAAAAAQSSEEQVFYHYQLTQGDPTSFDWNLNLYCNADDAPFAGLLTFDPELVPAPDWAERWETNEDGSVYTFYIRRDNKGWTNGDPVTAHDFRWSFVRLLDPANATPYPFILFDIKYAEAFNNAKPYDREGDPLHGKVPTADDLGLKAIDDFTLEITLEGPSGNFLNKVAYEATLPAHRPSVEKYGDKWASGEVPLVSNGPFKLDRWEHDVVVEMSKNENYWDAERIRLTKVIDPIVPASGVVLAYEQGKGEQRLDWTGIAAADIDRYMNDPELSKQLRPFFYPGIWMLLPSNGIPPFDKLEVRRAVSHAVDRSRLVEVAKNLEIEAYVMIPPGIFGNFDDPEIEQIQKFDPQLAMDALKGTEFEGGQNWPEITMWMRSNEEVYNADVLSVDIIAQLKQNLGMDIKIQQIPQTNFTEQLTQNKWQLVFIRWLYDYPDADNGYRDMFYSRKASGKRQAWSNSEFDDLCLAGPREIDPDKRLEIYKKAERIIQEDVGYIPLLHFYNQYAYKPWVKGQAVNKSGYSVPDFNIYQRMLSDIHVEGRPAE